MWAQLVKVRMKGGTEEEFEKVRNEMRTRQAQARPGFVRLLSMRNQRDPQEYYTLIVFESEEKAREGERGLEQDELFQRLRSLQEGTPEYVDLEVVDDVS